MSDAIKRDMSRFAEAVGRIPVSVWCEMVWAAWWFAGVVLSGIGRPVWLVPALGHILASRQVWRRSRSAWVWLAVTLLGECVVALLSLAGLPDADGLGVLFAGYAFIRLIMIHEAAGRLGAHWRRSLNRWSHRMFTGAVLVAFVWIVTA